jgi:phosphatidate phosphatase PAH1
MLVGMDDHGQVVLNGREVYSSKLNRGFRLDEDVVENVTLNAGKNLLVFKVVNETAQWKGSIRFTDPAGKLLENIRVSIEP